MRKPSLPLGNGATMVQTIPQKELRMTSSLDSNAAFRNRA